MKEFEYFQSLPLYLVANAFKLGLITSEEKRKMKQIIIANSPEDKFFINDMFYFFACFVLKNLFHD